MIPPFGDLLKNNNNSRRHAQTSPDVISNLEHDVIMYTVTVFSRTCLNRSHVIMNTSASNILYTVHTST